MTNRLLLILVPTVLVACAAPSPTDGQAPRTARVAAAPAPVTAIAPQSHWRATSRFGYGPYPEAAPGAQGQAWALAALAQAVEASHQPAQIPAEYRGFEAPLPQLFAQEKASLQERQKNRQAMTEVAAAAPSMAPPSPVKNERLFSQEIAPKAVAWRLLACSQPEVENPLLARMTEFWFNHLNVYDGKASDRAFVGHYVVNAIRPHALGRFEDLLLASARHPAMLNYLDQVRSRAEDSPSPLAGNAKTGINENYARELLELHTLGVNGGYSQNDVRALARILTGWTVDPSSDSGFRFIARWHDTGIKTLLGKPFTHSGVREGEDAIRWLARHPATAQRISLRLAQWFVADQPPPALVQQLAQRYLQTQGDIRAVMQTLIESPGTWAAHNQLYKTPMDYACSVLTALGPAAGEKQIQQAARFLREAGQPVHGWLTPDGYNTAASAWLSPEALTRRTDFAMLAGRAMPQAASLAPWLPTDTWARITQEPPGQQAGLALASPAFMRK